MTARSNSSFLGTGWSFPPTFVRATSSVLMVSAAVDIRQSLEILFSTRKGERLMVPEYGCDIWLLVFASVDTAFKTQVKDYIGQAILDWEPRIDLDSVDVQASASVEGVVLIEVGYTIRATNSRDNLVFPFYLDEGTLVTDVGGQ